MIAVSRDGGGTWKQVLASGAADTATFTSVYCPGAEAMWAVGQGVAFVLPGEAVYATRSADLFCIHGIADVAYVACTSAADVRGGGQPRFVWVTGTRAVHAVDAQHIWAVGDGGIVRASGGTAAAPAAWPATSTGTNEDLLAVHFADASNGWAVGAHGAIVHTADGTRWGPQTSGVSDMLKRKDDALRGVWFADARRGWAVGDGGIVIATTDGGAHWSRITSEWRRSEPEKVGGTVWGLDDGRRLTTSAGPGAQRTVVDALD
jgi:photosystem II stability/assembly factor-like uncharacterized protein